MYCIQDQLSPPPHPPLFFYVLSEPLAVLVSRGIRERGKMQKAAFTRELYGDILKYSFLLWMYVIIIIIIITVKDVSGTPMSVCVRMLCGALFGRSSSSPQRLRMVQKVALGIALEQ
eukprot:gene971-566_t